MSTLAQYWLEAKFRLGIQLLTGIGNQTFEKKAFLCSQSRKVSDGIIDVKLLLRIFSRVMLC